MTVEGHEGSLKDFRSPGWPEDFPQRLKRLLEMAGLSRQDLARLLGVKEGTVQTWLRGGARPKGGSYYGIVQLSRSVPGGFELMIYGRGLDDKVEE